MSFDSGSDRALPAGNGGLIDGRHLESLPNSASRDLLLHSLADQRPPAERQIFVNRNLRFEKIRHIGFDLDWTLADYDRDAMGELAFKRTAERLVEHHGYPSEIFRAELRPDFARRGLIIDRKFGTVLKMNRHRYVGRAYHGRRFFSREERADLYRKEPMNPGAERFYIVDTLFELPEVNLYSELIELKERGAPPLGLPGHDQLFKDVRSAIDSIHRNGVLKGEIVRELPRYLPRDEQLGLALERMALGGRRLMLITNSEWFYTDALCSHLFDGLLPGQSHWRELFDLVVVSAQKPAFFRAGQPFTELDDQGRPQGEVEVPRWGGLYAGGSRGRLMRLLDCPGEEVLYVGDHIYGDVLSSKMSSTWRTALIVAELEEEITVRQRLTPQLRHLDVLRAEIIDEICQAAERLSEVLYEKAAGTSGAETREPLHHVRQLISEIADEHRIMRRQADRLQKRVSKALNPFWGSLFKQADSKSFFGHQVDDFACLYTSRVSNFASYGSRHYYRVLRDAMIHENGL